MVHLLAYSFMNYTRRVFPKPVNVFLWLLCVIKLSKFGSYLHITNIWHFFLLKVGYLTPPPLPPGVTRYRDTPYCLAINFEEIPPWFVLNDFLWLYALSTGPNWEVICIIPIFGMIFGQNLGI